MAQRCSICGGDFPEDQLVPGGEGKICLSCEFDASRDRAPLVGPFFAVCALAALAPFALHYGQQASGPGFTVTSFSLGHMEGLQHDFIGIGGGLLGLTGGIALAVQGLRSKDWLAARLALGAVLALLGICQLLYGIGPT